jgi:predicted nucleic acid-binding Zn ribbon protein
MKKARATERRKAITVEQEIQRELKRAAAHAIHALRQCRSCLGSIPSDRGGRYCSEACRTVGTGAHVRETRRQNKHQGVAHVCPNCGTSFLSHVSGDVFCSRRCREPMQKRTKRGERRYPSVRDIPVDERNRIAQLFVLLRSARKHINIEFQKSTDL